ncbi:MAG: WD40/YVTN/BNR-like repeat-containing protein [Polyangiaceae bacterium]
MRRRRRLADTRVILVLGLASVALAWSTLARGASVWQQVASGTTTDLNGVWGSSADDVYVVGDGGVILHTTDRGKTWSLTSVASPSGARTTFNGVWGSGPTDVYAVGTEGTIVHSSDRGRTWQTQRAESASAPSSPKSTVLKSVWGSGPQDVYAVGSLDTQGVALRTKDGGRTWQPLDVKGVLVGVWGSSRHDVWMSLDTAGAYNSTDDGATWGLVGGGLTNQWTSLRVFGTSAFNVYLFGWSVVARTTDGGHSWTSEDSGATGLWGAGDTVFAVDGTGAIRRKPSGAPFIVHEIRRPMPGTRENLRLLGDRGWQQERAGAPGTGTWLRGVWGSSAEDVYAVGDAGTILHRVWSVGTAR